MKIQRIMIDGGFTCPNRDGTISRGGCTFCRNDSFAPDYCRRHDSITQQIQAGKQFFARRYHDMQYLAYFQSYSNTYADVATLRSRYDEALSVADVTGLVIGTRPDCLPDEVLDLLQEYNQRTSLEVEIGVESCHDHVLAAINRGHTWQQSRDAIVRTAGKGIRVGVHVILGLPGETREQMLQGARMISGLPVSTVKLHQLQILRDTPMASHFKASPQDFVQFPTAADYVSLVREYRSLLRPDISLGRIVSQCPSSMLIAPRWGLKPFQVQEML